MRILVDLQSCQTLSSRHRGIGRYSWSLFEAMVRQAGEHDIHVLLNGSFLETDAELHSKLLNCLPRENIHYWQGLHQTAELYAGNRWRTRANEVLREAYIRDLNVDYVHVSSLFEGLEDDAATSLGQDALTHPTAVTLYDLIPLINANHYLQSPDLSRWYYRKLHALKRANLLLAISESSRQEGIRYLDIPAERIVNISSAVDDRFFPAAQEHPKMAELRQRYHIHKPFVMYTGGIDFRKNIEGLIRAFALSELRQTYQLAIVCSVRDDDKHRLLKLAQQVGLHADDVIMTGYVEDEDLPILYQNCACFVFPSWHEGFGLPALEAMSCGAAVIGANTSSLPEVIGLEEALFDPHDDQSIATKLRQVLDNADFKQKLIQHGLQQAQKFSWDRSARLALDAMCASFKSATLTKNKSEAVAHTNSTPSYLPRLAFVSPLPPARSGIADYNAELIPELARYYEMTLVVADDAHKHASHDPYLSANFPILSVSDFRARASEFDRIVYHFGNSTFHADMFDLLLQFPGVVDQHDFYLSGVLAHLELHTSQPGVWHRALFHSHGWHALAQRFLSDDMRQVVYAYPCNLAVFQRALGIIVHSDYSKQLAKAWYQFDETIRPWHKIPHLHRMPQAHDRAAVRRALGIDKDSFLVTSFGMLGEPKLNDALLRCWIQSELGQHASCHLVFVGENDQGEFGQTLLQMIQDAPLPGNIKITGYASSETFEHYLVASDLSVQLRGLSRGETSGAVLDCLAHGIPTIINANGAMAEIPDHVVIKLPDAFTDLELVQGLNDSFQQRSLGKALSQRALTYMKETHAPAQVGLQHVHAIEASYQRAELHQQRQTIRAIAAIDATPSADDLADISRVLVPQRQWGGARRIVLDVSRHKISNKSSLANLLSQVILQTPQGWRLDPVVKVGKRYQHAADIVLPLFGMPAGLIENARLEMRADDIECDLLIDDTLKSVELQTDPIRGNSSEERGEKLTHLFELSAPHVFLHWKNPNPSSEEANFEMAKQFWQQILQHAHRT